MTMMAVASMDLHLRRHHGWALMVVTIMMAFVCRMSIFFSVFRFTTVMIEIKIHRSDHGLAMIIIMAVMGH